MRQYFTIATLKKLIHYLKINGLKRTLSKIRSVLSPAITYELVRNKSIYSKKQLEQQRNASFDRDITISIIVPLYNTPERFLSEMIGSVLNQTYGKWELCLADGSDDAHSYVGDRCKEYQKNDKRIKYVKLEKNGGISGNTNEALKISTGEYIALFDHDDLLHPAALHEVMKAICEGNADFIYTDESVFTKTPFDINQVHFKPDYAPDTLLANNYICHFSVFSRDILNAVGGFRSEYDGSQDHDFVLRATQASSCIAHIPEALYYWRCHPGSVASDIGAKSYAVTAGKKAVHDHITRLGMKNTVTSTDIYPTLYRIAFELESHPRVSIIIPNYEHVDDLKKCIDSIFKGTTYDNFDVLIVENNSSSPEIFDYYKNVQRVHSNVRVVKWSGAFNFSSICNFGVKNCSGDVLLFLNNDTEIITPRWIEEMLMYAQRKDVGAVGAKLYFPNNTIQHGGVLLGCGGVAGHYFIGLDKNAPGYYARLCNAQNQTAVTAACMMIRREAFVEAGGFEEDYAVAFNDIDFCMKLRKIGYLNVWTPFAELYHFESKSRGIEDTPEKQARFDRECRLFRERWAEELAYGDPYYNPNFELDGASFRFKRRSLPYPARYTRKKPGT